jgi:hypothetical protein
MWQGGKPSPGANVAWGEPKRICLLVSTFAQTPRRLSSAQYR